MEGVKLKVDDLLKVIRKNRKAHQGLFLRAVEGYKKEVLKELEVWMEEVKQGKVTRRYISLPEPKDHTEDYNGVINMLDMTSSEEVELSQREFEWYVRDRWEWMELAFATNSGYANN